MPLLRRATASCTPGRDAGRRAARVVSAGPARDGREMAPGALRRRSAWSSTLIAGLELARQGEVKLGQGGGFRTHPCRPGWGAFSALMAAISTGIRRRAKRGPHGILACTDPAGDLLAADNLDTGFARMKVIDMTLPMAFRAGSHRSRATPGSPAKEARLSALDCRSSGNIFYKTDPT